MIDKLTIYDNEGVTLDRYTVFHKDENDGALSLSHNPDAPNGVSLFYSATKGDHLGKRIEFNKLPKDVQNHIVGRFINHESI